MVERSEREKNAYNSKSINRKFYNSIFSHCNAFYFPEIQKQFSNWYRRAQIQDVLEIGSSSWYNLIYKNDLIYPKSLSCINISEIELNKGIDLRSQLTDFTPKVNFHQMDANNLDFEDSQFDFVFGGGILHHLDFTTAIREIHRVLRPNGIIWFKEPLSINPIGKLVRLLTPKARTKDERPLGLKELNEIENLFLTENFYEALLTVPAGVVSRFVFDSPKNFLTRAAFDIDQNLLKIPYLQLLSRNVIIQGIKLNSA